MIARLGWKFKNKITRFLIIAGEAKSEQIESDIIVLTKPDKSPKNSSGKLHLLERDNFLC